MKLKLQVNFTGKGKGIYSYLKDYVFSIKSRKRFKVKEGQRTHIKVTLYDKGGALKNIKNRIAIQYDINFEDIDNKVLKKEEMD